MPAIFSSAFLKTTPLDNSGDRRANQITADLYLQHDIWAVFEGVSRNP